MHEPGSGGDIRRLSGGGGGGEQSLAGPLQFELFFALRAPFSEMVITMDSCSIFSRKLYSHADDSQGHGLELLASLHRLPAPSPAEAGRGLDDATP